MGGLQWHIIFIFYFITLHSLAPKLKAWQMDSWTMAVFDLRFPHYTKNAQRMKIVFCACRNQLNHRYDGSTQPATGSAAAAAATAMSTTTSDARIS